MQHLVGKPALSSPGTCTYLGEDPQDRQLSQGIRRTALRLAKGSRPGKASIDPGGRYGAVSTRQVRPHLRRSKNASGDHSSMNATYVLRWTDSSCRRRQVCRGHRRPLALIITVALSALLVVRLSGQPGAIDLGVYRAAGLAVMSGVDPYAADFGQRFGTGLPFTYPPAAAILAVPLALVTKSVAYLAWLGINFVIFWVAVKTWFRGTTPLDILGMPLLFVALLWCGPVTEVLALGQLGIIITCGCYWAATSPRRSSALIIGVLAAVKLTPLIFVAYFLLVRDFRRAAYASVGFLVTTLCGWALMSEASHNYWTRIVKDPSRIGDLAYFANQSLLGLLARMSLDRMWWPIVGVATIAGLLLARRLALKVRQPAAAVVAVGLLSLVVSPVSWQHHAVWVVPAFAAVLVVVVDRRVKLLAVVAFGLTFIGAPLLASRSHSALLSPAVNALLASVVTLLIILLLAASPAASWPLRRGQNPNQ
ncbi:MAG: alpha,2-mannosyltransferase [Actinomycetota bacterium]|nr:alpha,2-mannosyltransferase [Actinomycetota bacterium]